MFHKFIAADNKTRQKVLQASQSHVCVYEHVYVYIRVRSEEKKIVCFSSYLYLHLMLSCRDRKIDDPAVMES